MLVSFKNGIDISAIDLSIFGTVGSAIISLLPSKVYDKLKKANPTVPNIDKC